MKRTLSAVLIALLLLSLCLTACAEETQQETFISGDYEYVLLEDGTAEIVMYHGKENHLIISDKLNGHSVTAIGDQSFYKCSSLTSVSIPDTISTVGVNPFAYCDKLIKLMVSPDHPYLAVIDGVLFSKQDKRLICYPEGKMEKSYKIPSGIEIIGERAFSNCSRLTSITIPDSILSIGDLAFFNCSNLTSISIPDGVASVGYATFYGCSRLTTISIPESVISIGNWTFYGCSRLNKITLPNGIISIGDKAFSDCSNLTSINIPNSVVKVGDNPFTYCESLSKIIVSFDHPFLEVIDGVLFSKQDRRLICYPKGKDGSSFQIPHGTQIIGDSAFSSCSRLITVTIPNTTTFINEYAFSNCFNLISVTIPDNVTFISDSSFYGCHNLTITVRRDSYAAQYCKENGLNYTYPDSLDWLND